MSYGGTMHQAEMVRRALVAMQADRDALAADLETTRRACSICGHEWRRHDPEDGCCDAHDEEIIGVCRCGRDMAWMHERIAERSRDALASGDGSDEL